jgi:hypothetical protein
MTALDLQVCSRGRQHAVFQAEGDPHDSAWLRSQLRSWLKGNHWHENNWDKFEIVARERGANRVITRTRAV